VVLRGFPERNAAPKKRKYTVKLIGEVTLRRAPLDASARLYGLGADQIRELADCRELRYFSSRKLDSKLTLDGKNQLNMRHAIPA